MVPRGVLAEGDPAVVRRVVRALVLEVRGGGDPPTAAEVESVRLLDASALDLPGVVATSAGGWTALGPAGLDEPDPRVLQVPGTTPWEALRWRVEATTPDSASEGQLQLGLAGAWQPATVKVDERVLVPGARAELAQVVLGGLDDLDTVVARTRVAGDRVLTAGGTRKLQDVFVDAGVPAPAARPRPGGGRGRAGGVGARPGGRRGGPPGGAGRPAGAPGRHPGPAALTGPLRWPPPPSLVARVVSASLVAIGPAVVEPAAAPPASEVPPPAEAIPASLVDSIERVLITSEKIQERLAEIAAEIDRDYEGVDPLLLVGVLKGAYVVMADLARHVSHPHQRRLHGRARRTGRRPGPRAWCASSRTSTPRSRAATS